MDKRARKGVWPDRSMEKNDHPGVSQFDIWCTGWDYRNEKCVDLAVQGTLAGVYTHTINAKY